MGDGLGVSERVIFLREMRQLSSLVEAGRDLLCKSRLISLDLDVSAKLSELGVVYEEIWDHIDIGELYSLREEAYHLRETWFRNAGPSLPRELRHIISLDKEAWTYAFRDALVACKLYQRSVARTTKELYIWGPFERHAWWEHASDVPDAVWAFLAEQAGLVLHILPASAGVIPTGRRSLRAERLIRAAARKILPSAVREAYRGVHDAGGWAMTLHLARMRRRIYSLPKGPVLFFVAMGEERRYASLCAALQKLLGDRLKLLSTGKSVAVGDIRYWAIASLNSTLGGLLGRVSFPEAIPKFSPSDLPIAREYPYIFKNDHLGFQFEYYLHKRWPHVASFLSMVYSYFKVVRPTVILVTDMPYGFQPVICMAAKKLGIPVVTLPHSGTPSIERLRLQADAAIVWTHDYKMRLVDEGMSADRVHVVGPPSSMVFEAFPHSNAHKSWLCGDKRKMVLILSEKPVQGLLAAINLSVYREIVWELLRIPRDLQDKVCLVWKGHPLPGADYNYFYQVAVRASEFPNLVSLTGHESLHALVEKSDVVVVPNTPTSAYLAALSLRKPLLFINAAGLKAELFKPAQWKGLVVEKISDIWPTLRRALWDNHFRGFLLKENFALLREITEDCSLLSAEQLASRIAPIIREVGSLSHGNTAKELDVHGPEYEM